MEELACVHRDLERVECALSYQARQRTYLRGAERTVARCGGGRRLWTPSHHNAYMSKRHSCMGLLTTIEGPYLRLTHTVYVWLASLSVTTRRSGQRHASNGVHLGARQANENNGVCAHTRRGHNNNAARVVGVQSASGSCDCRRCHRRRDGYGNTRSCHSG